MTSKERLLAAITGKEVDRVPWSPFLAYIWESFPKEVQEQGSLKFLQDMGADPLFRGSHVLFEMVRNHCVIRTIKEENEQVTTYETPVGRLHSKHIYSPAGNTWFLMEHPIKTSEDFKILTYINENTSVSPNIKGFVKDYEALGEKGLYVPIIGSEMKSSFQSMLEHWVGTAELVYALMDYPEVVEACLAAMQQVSIKTVEISVQSPAEAFIFWEDSSTTNTSPAFFEKYVVPEINTWGRQIHKENKYLIHHACGHLKGLISLMGNTEIDMIESISPPPTGNIELWEAKKLLPDHIGLIGGIEPTVFLRSTMDELENYVINLLEKMGSQRYILANSDSCPPGVSIEKFTLVSEIISRRLKRE